MAISRQQKCGIVILKLIADGWVHSFKIKSNRKVCRARLVAKEYLLEDDKEEVFAPVAKYAILQTLICIPNEFDMKVAKLDVSTAF